MKTLYELADSLGLPFRGNGQCLISSVGTLAHAESSQISFLANPKYTNQLQNTRAGAVILSESVADKFSGNVLIAPDPYVAFAKVARLFVDAKQTNTYIHPQSFIHPEAQVADDVSVGAFTVIDADVIVGQRCQIGHHVTIESGVVLGNDCVIKSGVTIESGCKLGQRCIIHSGAVIGADGFGLARDEDGWLKIPQTGIVRLGNDCEIGANTTIDCGTIDDTILGNDVRLDNQIQIGHNVHIGDHTIMAGCTAVAGSTMIGRNCLIGGGVGIVGHIEICDNVTIQAMSLVTHSIKEAGQFSGAAPLQKVADWRKNAARYRQLDQWVRKVNQLEKKK